MSERILRALRLKTDPGVFFTTVGVIVAFVVGIPLGMVAAKVRDRWGDAILRVFAILCYATPVFFSGLLLKLVFGIWLNWLPVNGRASTRVELRLSRGTMFLLTVMLAWPRRSSMAAPVISMSAKSSSSR